MGPNSTKKNPQIIPKPNLDINKQNVNNENHNNDINKEIFLTTRTKDLNTNYNIESETIKQEKKNKSTVKLKTHKIFKILDMFRLFSFNNYFTYFF